MSKDETRRLMGTNLSGGLPRMGSGNTRHTRTGEHTQIYKPRNEELMDEEELLQEKRDAAAFIDQGPVVGWLVIVRGPGRGSSHSLSYGTTMIGQAPSDQGVRVQLDFGDPEISRDHASVVFDRKKLRYYLRPVQEATNMSYIDDEPILGPTEITDGQTIALTSQTHVRFIALCRDGFDWETVR